MADNYLPIMIADIYRLQVHNASITVRQWFGHFSEGSKTLLVARHHVITEPRALIKLQRRTRDLVGGVAKKQTPV